MQKQATSSAVQFSSVADLSLGLTEEEKNFLFCRLEVLRTWQDVKVESVNQVVQSHISSHSHAMISLNLSLGRLYCKSSLMHSAPQTKRAGPAMWIGSQVRKNDVQCE